MADQTFGDVKINGTLEVAGDKTNPSNITLDVTSGTVAVTGDLAASGALSAASLTTSGTVSAASLTTSGTVTANSVNSSGLVSSSAGFQIFGLGVGWNAYISGSANYFLSADPNVWAARLDHTTACWTVWGSPDFFAQERKKYSPLQEPLKKVLSLSGVESAVSSDRKTFAVDKQSVAEQLPELVEKDADGSASYPAESPYAALLVEAVKELHGIVEQQAKEIASLRAEMAEG